MTSEDENEEWSSNTFSDCISLFRYKHSRESSTIDVVRFRQLLPPAVRYTLAAIRRVTITGRSQLHLNVNRRALSPLSRYRNLTLQVCLNEDYLPNVFQVSYRPKFPKRSVNLV